MYLLCNNQPCSCDIPANFGIRSRKRDCLQVPFAYDNHADNFADITASIYEEMETLNAAAYKTEAAYAQVLFYDSRDIYLIVKVSYDPAPDTETDKERWERQRKADLNFLRGTPEAEELHHPKTVELKFPARLSVAEVESFGHDFFDRPCRETGLNKILYDLYKRKYAARMWARLATA